MRQSPRDWLSRGKKEGPRRICNAARATVPPEVRREDGKGILQLLGVYFRISSRKRPAVSAAIEVTKRCFPDAYRDLQNAYS